MINFGSEDYAVGKRGPRSEKQLIFIEGSVVHHGIQISVTIAPSCVPSLLLKPVPNFHSPAHLCGAHEGLQHLGPFGNIPNIVAELTGDNIPKDFSEDQGYPDPPNPCPLGKTADDGCLENAPDTAEFSREFQLNQHLFDPEHDYPGLGKWNKKLLYEKMKGGQRRKRRKAFRATKLRWRVLLSSSSSGMGPGEQVSPGIYYRTRSSQVPELTGIGKPEKGSRRAGAGQPPPAGSHFRGCRLIGTRQALVSPRCSSLATPL
ncbi:hypothetical protein ACRRTK_013943 [Alexandromys fortis]